MQDIGDIVLIKAIVRHPHWKRTRGCSGLSDSIVASSVRQLLATGRSRACARRRCSDSGLCLSEGVMTFGLPERPLDWENVSSFPFCPKFSPL